MAVEKDRAIVVRSFDLREADRIITFCTPNFGKVGVVARGIRKARSRLGASLQLFNIGELVFFQRSNRDLHYVNTFDVSEPLGVQFRDPISIAYASYFAQLAEIASMESEANVPLFDVLDAGLRAIRAAERLASARAAARSFEAKLLTLSGYRPHLESCVVCRGELPTGEISVGIGLGGALCARHAHQDRTIIVTPGALDAARRLGRIAFSEARSQELTRREQAELKRLLGAFVSERLERRLRCAEYIDHLERGLTDDAVLAC